jgi:hypothetical protein
LIDAAEQLAQLGREFERRRRYDGRERRTMGQLRGQGAGGNDGNEDIRMESGPVPHEQYMGIVSIDGNLSFVVREMERRRREEGGHGEEDSAMEPVVSMTNRGGYSEGIMQNAQRMTAVLRERDSQRRHEAENDGGDAGREDTGPEEGYMLTRARAITRSPPPSTAIRPFFPGSSADLTSQGSSTSRSAAGSWEISEFFSWMSNPSDSTSQTSTSPISGVQHSPAPIPLGGTEYESTDESASDPEMEAQMGFGGLMRGRGSRVEQTAREIVGEQEWIRREQAALARWRRSREFVRPLLLEDEEREEEHEEEEEAADRYIRLEDYFP